MKCLHRRFLALSMVVGLVGAAFGAAATQPTSRPYPLTTCVVSGEKLGGDMGEPVVCTYGGREVHLCCKMCIATFKKDPAKYLEKLDAAETANPSTRPSGK